MTGRPPMSIEQQAELVEYLIERCTLKSGVREGEIAAETLMSVSVDEVADLRSLAQRLRRMAPHEDAIRELVVGK